MHFTLANTRAAVLQAALRARGRTGDGHRYRERMNTPDTAKAGAPLACVALVTHSESGAGSSRLQAQISRDGWTPERGETAQPDPCAARQPAPSGARPNTLPARVIRQRKHEQSAVDEGQHHQASTPLTGLYYAQANITTSDVNLQATKIPQWRSHRSVLSGFNGVPGDWGCGSGYPPGQQQADRH